MRTALKWTVGVVLALLVALALFISFGLNTLRGPIIRAVWSWLHPRFRVEKVTFANADWAKEDYLFSADAVEAEVRLLPLLGGFIVLPQVRLEGAEVNLEQDEQGRRNWILDAQRDKEKKDSRVSIELLTLDQGHLSYADAALDIDLQADLNTDGSGVVFAVVGTYQGLDLSA